MSADEISPMSYFPVGTRVQHGDGSFGVVVRVVAAVNGRRLSLIRWDDLSATRGGDDVRPVVAA